MKIERDKDRPGKWRIDVTIAKRRYRETDFNTKKDAEDFVVELRTQAKRGKHRLALERPRFTLEELVDERILQVQGLPSGRGQVKTLRSFLWSFGPGFEIDDVKMSHLRDWSKPFIRRRLSPNTINSYLSVVSGMFRAAPELLRGLDEDWRGPKVPWLKVNRRGRERVISREELAAVLAALRSADQTAANGRRFQEAELTARRDVADCFELAVHTGMRGKEVRCLEWSEVDLSEAEAQLPSGKTKTGEPRTVLLNRRAMEILRDRNLVRKSRFVFPRPDNKRPRLEIAPVVRKVARALGLRYGRNLPDGFSPHDTRHTATTVMMRRGKDMKTVQDVLGHSDRVMTLRYSHSTRQSRREAVESVSESLAESPKSRQAENPS